MRHRDLLVELDITSSSRWSKAKDKLCADARYAALDRAARDVVFKAYVAEVEVRRRRAALPEAH